jgi:uncharacterized 2Fe-2S/4Fe-4S cluster protein (DUF4445 family)
MVLLCEWFAARRARPVLPRAGIAARHPSVLEALPLGEPWSATEASGRILVMDMVRVYFMERDVETDVQAGSTVHAAAAEAGVVLDAPCGGLGTCGSCRVKASGGVREPGPAEREALSPADLATGWRLACLARIDGPGPVTIERTVATFAPSIETAAEAPRVAAAPRSGLGAAVDLGTTTLAVALHDLSDGRRLGTAAALNPQVAFGHDVLVRVSRAISGEGEALRAAVASQLHRLFTELVEVSAGGRTDLVDIVVVGNPSMVHLLLGRDPSPLLAPPFEGALLDSIDIAARTVGLTAAEGTQVHFGAAVSAFVGSDAVAGVLATHLVERGYPVLLVDLGTNGEIVLRARGATLATSAAAGPALEGVSISSGMRAEKGAIERVRFVDGRLQVSTIGEVTPVGICGSGLLDAVAALLEAGALDASGRLLAEGQLAPLVSSTPDGDRFELASDIYLTQQDIRAVQLAKGAVATAIDVLLGEADITPDAVREVMVAGAFGSHVSPPALVRLGVFPPEWADRVTFAGNTALAGATEMLLDPASRATATALAREARSVPLATRQDFQRRFLAALDFPDLT